MEVKVIIAPDGKVRVVLEDGTFDEAKDQIRDIFAWLEAEGIQVDDITQAEAHRHVGESVYTNVRG